MRRTLESALISLASQGRVFCSEADFQFSLAWEIKQTCHHAHVFLEKPVVVRSKTLHVDIVVLINKQYFYIELKYPTSPCTYTFKDETPVSLTSQSAEDLLRYDYCKDILRLYGIYSVAPDSFGGGYAILLTNDELIYKEPRFHNNKVLDYSFRIHERRDAVFPYPQPGRVIWNNKDKSDGHWTNSGGRKNSFVLPTISTCWENYLTFHDDNSSLQVFKYLINECNEASVNEQLIHSIDKLFED